MGDYARKPLNYKRGRCKEFERICREEAAAGEVVVVASPLVCKADFPCLAHIFVLAGVLAPCEVCAPKIAQMRDLHGYVKRGDFWFSNGITAGQQQVVEAKIKELASIDARLADVRNFLNEERETQDVRTSADVEREEAEREQL